MKSSHQTINKGFTLVEILVVIAIIATLIGISAPIIIRQAEKGKEVEASQMMRDIQTAIDEYEKDYLILPVGSQATAVTDPTTDSTLSDAEFATMLTILSAKNVYGQNSKEKSYFDGRPAKDASSNPRAGVTLGENVITGLYDPWGAQYVIRIDYDLDEELTLDGGFGDYSGDELKFTKIAIASKGRDGILDKKNDVLSWKAEE